MGLQVDPPFGLGQTLGTTGVTDSLYGLASGASYGDNWVGAVKEFTDVNPVTGAVRSNRRKVCIAVRNTSSITLLPKRVVRLAGTGTALFGAADGYASTTNEELVGVVDEFLTGGVAANDVFWVTVDGPTEVAVALSGTDVAVRNRLSVITAATSGATTAGRVTVSPLSSSTAGANDNGIGVIGYACSAGATTGAAVLALVRSKAV
jgi:hypothetical protein